MSGKIVRPHASVFACGVFVCAVGCGVYSSGEKTRMSDSATRRLPGAAEPFGRGERMAARLVLFEDGGHARREFPVVDEGVDFEVVFETAEVHVRGADDREHVVDDEQFGVQESRHVEEYLYASLHHVVEVGVRRQIHDLRIGACGEHQPHVDAASAASCSAELRTSDGR